MVLLLLLLLFVGLLGAPLWGANEQNVFDLADSVYDQVEALFLEQGKALPSSAKPWTQDEVRFLLGKLDPSTFSPQAKALYGAVQAAAPAPRVASFEGFFSPELYVHTNTEFDDSNDWMLTYEQRAPVFSFRFETWLTDHFYGFMGFPELRTSKRVFTGDSAHLDDWTECWLGEHYVDANLAFAYRDKSVVGADASYPVRGFLSLGGPGWNVQLGRDRIDWGAGETGNFLVDGHVQYHNELHFAAYQSFFKYTFLVSAFPNPKEIEKARTYPGDPWSDNSPLYGIKLFLAHRFEFRLLEDKLGLAVTEGVMYQPEHGTVDLRELNPFMFYHNYYIDSDANSIVQFDVDYTPWPRWNFYGQLAIDEIRFILTESRTSSSVHPDAFGLLAGVKHVRPLAGGWLRSTFECAYTYPYLYLRTQESSKDNTEAGSDRYDNLNFIIAIRRWANGEIDYDMQNMGYPYSGDSIVLQATTKYTVPDDWAVQARCFYLIHGVKWMEGEVYGAESYDGKMNSGWYKGPEEYDRQTPYGGWRRAIRRLVLGLNGQKTFSEKMLGYGEIDVTHVANKDHVPSNDEWDVQCGMGFRYKLF